MKKYKGWELVKMASEGKIEDKKEFCIVFTDISIKYDKEKGAFLIGEGLLESELPMKYFSGDTEFIELCKFHTFEEALKSKKKLRISDRYKIIAGSDCGKMYENGFFVCIDEILYLISNHFPAGTVREILTTKCWLIEGE